MCTLVITHTVLWYGERQEASARWLVCVAHGMYAVAALRARIVYAISVEACESWRKAGQSGVDEELGAPARRPSHHGKTGAMEQFFFAELSKRSDILAWEVHRDRDAAYEAVLDPVPQSEMPLGRVLPVGISQRVAGNAVPRSMSPSRSAR